VGSREKMWPRECRWNLGDRKKLYFLDIINANIGVVLKKVLLSWLRVEIH
jgi:hypothetical protein